MKTIKKILKSKIRNFWLLFGVTLLTAYLAVYLKREISFIHQNRLVTLIVYFVSFVVAYFIVQVVTYIYTYFYFKHKKNRH